MLQLVELRFKNIGRFVEEQVVNFENLGEFVQVDGQNNNTGGSSGSGKSTIFNALDYLLGINKLAATILQSRLTKDAIWVQGVFKYSDSESGESIVITRSKSSIKIVMLDGTIDGKKAEDHIDRMMGMPRDLFRKVIHKRQNEGGFFLDLTPKEMHDFLMDCVGLSPFKEKYGIIEAKLSNLEAYISTEQQYLERMKASLSATQDAILALGLAPVQDMHKEVILELKEKVDRSAAGFMEVKSRCEALVQEYVRNRPVHSNPQYDGTVRENLERRRKTIESEISATLEAERQRQDGIRRQISEKILTRSAIMARIDKGARAKEDAAKLAAEIKSIRACTCPTCTQKWETEGAIAAANEKMSALIVLKKTIDDADRAQSFELKQLDEEVSDLKILSSPRVDPKLSDLNEDLEEITEQILEEKRKEGVLYDQLTEENKKKLDTFLAGQAELQKKLDVEIEQARGQMDLDRRVFDVAVQKFKAYEEARSRYDKSYNELKKKEETFTKQLESCKSNLESATKEQILALETKKAIKYYVSYSFDEALDAIGDKATKIIRCIPNTSNATIQFEGTKETKEGKIKEEVNAVISVDGELGVPIKSLSGGERSAVDLAVDLAVIDYIETKTGKGLNIFILDEPFNGLGTVEIEMALEVLKNSNTNKKLTIVDHNPEVKQMVQDRLVVVRDGLTSKVA